MTFWIKFLNKVLNITPSVPLIFLSGEKITNTIEKINILNQVFASQCTLLKNSSKPPSLLMNTNKHLNTISIKKNDKTSIIWSLNLAKAHGFDKISIRMIKLCGDSITLPSITLFVHPRCFSWDMENKQHNSYRPISLLPILAKVFESLLFNSLFSHFHDISLFTECQSGSFHSTWNAITTWLQATHWSSIPRYIESLW